MSAAAGWLSPSDRPASWPGSSSAVPISTSLNATGIPSSRSASSHAVRGEALGDLAGRDEVRREHVDHPRGDFPVKEQDPGDAGHRAAGGKLQRVGLVGGGPGRLHAQVPAVGLDAELFGDARVGLQPSELGDAA
jgi:hypothetical protein